MRELYSTGLAIVSEILIVVVTITFALVQLPEIYAAEVTSVSRAA